MTLDEPPRKLRWPRSHRFSLSERGRTAEVEYREKIVSSRAEPGRASFDSARSAWATAHGLNADDGLYLAELATGPITFAQIVTALESCGKNRGDAIAALERLADAGMIAPAPSAA
jgi:hypothetical protein